MKGSTSHLPKVIQFTESLETTEKALLHSNTAKEQLALFTRQFSQLMDFPNDLRGEKWKTRVLSRHVNKSIPGVRQENLNTSNIIP